MKITPSFKKSYRLTVFFAVLCTFGNVAQGQTISGIGTRDCKAFLFALEKQSEEAIDAYLSWSQGFISGANVVSEGALDVQIDHGGLLHALANSCRARPKQRIYEAIQELTDLYR